MKRKRRQHLPKVHGDIGPDDTARLFQRFRWSQYTPAGTVERAGFFARQAARNGTSDGWSWGARAVILVVPLVIGVALLVAVITQLLD
jgi:hypothetical protein